MKNKQLLNICYKFFNRYITSNKLIEQLENIDKDELTNEDIGEMNKLTDEIKNIMNNVPNEIDDYILNRKERLKNLMEKIKEIPPNDEYNDFIDKQLKNINKEYNDEMDSYERWYKITEYIDNNNYFTKCFESLSNYELLEFIAQNISAPNPPYITQEKFEELVKIGIEKDKREWLWRLAFNYENKNINFDSITDYFIRVNDGYYLSELISAVGSCLDIDKIIDRINDKELINDLKDRKSVLKSNVTEEQFNKLIDKLEK